MKIISCDAEVDGLYGPSFAIAATVRVDGVETARFEGRIPDSAVTDGWVQANVLPALAGMPITQSSSEELEESFWAFWQAQKEGATVMAHCGSPVESGLFRRCVERKLDERAFAGPYPCLHDVGTALLALGEDPSSVDGYNRKNGIAVPFAGVAHHPMYDATAAAAAWEHAMARLQKMSA